jgi:hypothetical protein
MPVGRECCWESSAASIHLSEQSPSWTSHPEIWCGLSTQAVNDNGRYRQHRADAIYKPQLRLKILCVRGSRARIYRLGMETSIAVVGVFHPLDAATRGYFSGW